MPKFEDGSYSCFPGDALIAKVLSGRCQMRYTRAAVGTGYIPEGMTPKTMTEPAGYVMDAKIAGVSEPINGECQVTVQINSADVETGFYATGILLYAEDPDEGEVPYTYLVLENGPDWIRPSFSAIGKIAEYDLIAAVGSVDTVFAVIAPDSFVTVAELQAAIQKHDEDLRAHAPKRYVITQRERDPGKPGYGLGGGGEQTVVLDTGPYTGETEISVVVSGMEYDANNLTQNGDAAKDGTLIITHTEESNYGNT